MYWFFASDRRREFLGQDTIHPESYPIVEKLFQLIGVEIDQIGSEKCNRLLQELDVEKTAQELDLWSADAAVTLSKHYLTRARSTGRTAASSPSFGCIGVKRFKSGDAAQRDRSKCGGLWGICRYGLKNDGLVHISKLSKRFVRNPMDVVSVGDIVDVWVLSVDEERERVGLSMIPVQEDQMSVVKEHKH